MDYNFIPRKIIFNKLIVIIHYKQFYTAIFVKIMDANWMIVLNDNNKKNKIK